MSKIIAVCGSAESGKTTNGLKIAQKIYEQTHKPVIFFSTDLHIPALAYIFPHSKESDLYSVGKALDRTEIDKEDIIKCIVTAKGMSDFGYLGFKLGENKYSYARVTENKIVKFLCRLREISEYIVVDCSSDSNDNISALARTEADVVIQMITPDIKCLTYYASAKEQFDAVSDKTIKVMCIKESNMYLPVQEVKSHFMNIAFTIPYSNNLLKQSFTGSLSEKISDTKYETAIAEVIKAVI